MKHTPEQERILKKLEKLIKLKDGAEEIGSLEEAANAAARIQELLTKYNLALADVSSGEDEVDNILHVCFDLQGTPFWKRNESTFCADIMWAICRNNDARMILMRRGDIAKNPPQFRIFAQNGTHDFLIQLYASIMEQIRKLEAKSWSEYEGESKRNKYRRDYFLGATIAITKKLEEQRSEMEAEHSTALMVISDKLTKKVEEVYPNSRPVSRRDREVSQGFLNGHRDGSTKVSTARNRIN